MNKLKKKRVISVLKYTWPLYILSTVIVAILINVIFVITHRIPAYQTLTLFVSGEVTNPKQLEADMLDKYQNKELKTFSCIEAKPEDSGGYNTKLTINGYNSADVLIITASKLEKLVVSAFALDMSEELISNYYQGYTLFAQDEVNYGVKLDKEKVKDYMTLPNEDCYMVLNGKSVNTGKYSSSQIEEHDNALTLVKDWGM